MAGANFKPFATRDLHNSSFLDSPSTMSAAHHQRAFETSRRPFIVRGRQALAEDPFVGPSMPSFATESEKERARKAKIAQEILRTNHQMGTILWKPGMGIHGDSGINRDTAAGIATREQETTRMPLTDDKFYTPPNRQRRGHYPTSSNACTRGSSSCHQNSLGSASEFSPGEGFSRRERLTELDTSSATCHSTPRDGHESYHEAVDVLDSLDGSTFVPSDFTECSPESDGSSLSSETAWEVALQLDEEERRLMAALRSRQF
ncbi:hypothetical protein QBC37DRAFT_481446 [Rhypophila decipiens]|uniref:Uncharacterized protein n=1 Tax=Rhypophila decipiens TaxID=261697 RepID=A0AAN6YAM6_9PEZI|nr:hypothetical protein QBC37DRAFT_481446 [Rhypophila decipiens]